MQARNILQNLDWIESAKVQRLFPNQLVVEVTDGPEVAVGDEVVLIGRQGDEEITTGEWAEMLGTISYEIVCGFGPRLPRRHLTRISHGAGFVDGWADRPAGPGPDPSGGGGS